MNDLARNIVEALARGQFEPIEVKQEFGYYGRNRITVEMEERYGNVNPAYIAAGKATRLGYPEIERVIYNDPATIVLWKDGTKTVVRCHEADGYDERTGFLLCCAKRLFGNTGRYNDAMKAHVPEKTRFAQAIDHIAALLGAL